jgi:hypothetical protein
MQTWLEFYAVSGAVAATLLGLLFVSVSMNTAAILGEGHENSRRLAEQAFQNYLSVLLVSLLALFPQITITEFSLTALGLTAVSSIWVLVRFYLSVAKPQDRESRLLPLRRHLSSLIGFGTLTTAALRMIATKEDHRSWFAAGIVVLLGSATTVSWELLIRIARMKPQAPGV